MEQAAVTPIQQSSPPQLQLATVAEKPFNISTNRLLAQKLSWKKTGLLTLLGRNKSEHYSTIFLRKKGKNGKLREIHNPDGLMRQAQYRILKNILEKIEVPDYIYAFEKDRSIPQMAANHVGKRIVVSLDLKDFFTSIKQYHLYQLFQHLGFGASPARTLSELCTFKSFVPQGALTSPKVSNIITALTFGPILKEYCDNKGYTFSVYADDIVVSCDHKLDGEDGRDTVRSLIQFITSVVSRFGFSINREKIKVMSKNRRQWVCGCTVNEKVNMLKTERYTLKAIVHNTAKNGIEAEAAKNNLTSSEFYARILGRLNWFSQLNPIAGSTLKTKFMQICAELGQPTVVTEAVEIPGESAGSEMNQESETPIPAPW